MDTFISNDPQLDMIDDNIASYGRIALQGLATSGSQDWDRAFSSTGVLNKWYVAPYRVELIVRQLRWFQEWFKIPDVN